MKLIFDNLSSKISKLTTNEYSTFSFNLNFYQKKLDLRFMLYGLD